MQPAGTVRLYWLPLGAGGVVVRYNGKIYESLVARAQRRPPRPLFHSALEVGVASGWYVVEMAPVWGLGVAERGAVVQGPVGATWLGRSRLFRYEVRCWKDGRIPDVAEAVGSPVLVRGDSAMAERLLALVPSVPPLTWGRDELRLGDMWNSNSLVSWLLARAGAEVGALQPPRGGRAPGWGAGTTLAGRQCALPSIGTAGAEGGRLTRPRRG